MKHSVIPDNVRTRVSPWLDGDTLLKMMKGALPPTIVVAMYQSNAIANITENVGYLMAIMAIISQCLFPRGKFLRIMFHIVLSTCAAASICCLAVLSAIKARSHGANSASETNVYNSSACAVCGVWLLFVIWIANTLRAYQPVWLQDPMVAFSIFSGVTLTNAARFTTMTQGLDFIKQLLITFLLGFAVATGVSLLILPITSRRQVFKDAIFYAKATQNVLKTAAQYVEVAQHRHEPGKVSTLDHASEPQLSTKDASRTTAVVDKSRILQAAMAELVRLHDKMRADLTLAESEGAWGKLDETDLHGLFTHLRSIMLPLAGISMLPDIFQKLPNDWNVIDHVGTMQDHWKLFLHYLHLELEEATEIVMLSIQHAFVILEIVDSKSICQLTEDVGMHPYSDVEKSVQNATPGQPNFTSRLHQSIDEFYDRRRDRSGNNPLAQSYANAHSQLEPTLTKIAKHGEESFKFLFLKHLVHDLLQAALVLAQFADSEIIRKHMKHNRIIFPRKLLPTEGLIFHQHDQEFHGRIHNDSMKNHRSPEHLPAATWWERFGERLGLFLQVLASNQSSFGFRAAAASFSVAILAFLHKTQEFFFEQRLIWILIVIAIGMSPNSGASLLGFVNRIIGTIISFAFALAVWYIVVGRTAGVVVLIYLANMFGYYFYVRKPKIFGASVISIVTFNVIVDYELQVNKLGISRATSNGQPYYPIYLFGSYKLLCVVIACAISLVWTIFPYPLTSGSQARKLLGRSLFVLANFYSCVHTTIQVWISDQPDQAKKAFPLLDAAKKRLFAEEMQLLTVLRTQSNFTRFDFPLGGKFPASTYNNVVSEIQTVVMSMTLMTHLIGKDRNLSTCTEGSWLRNLARAIESTNFNSHISTSLLCHLSAAVSNSIALPPHLSPPASFALARELRSFNAELLDVKNADDITFSTFVSLEVLSALVSVSLSSLAREIRSLVGEVKFDGYAQD